MSDIEIRLATPGDAEAIATIYNHYVVTSIATFDKQPGTVEERVAWLADHLEHTHPVFVAQRGDDIIGWGSLSPYRARAAWSRTVEIGIYLREGETGAGVGRMLLDTLVARAVEAGHHALIGQVVAENAASIRLLERAGFERVGYLPEVGCKFGRWIDLVMLQRTLPAEAEC